jgi:hypothetical protein
MSTEPRPKFSPEIAAIAAAEIVSDLIEQGHLNESQRSQSVADLVRYGDRYADGYEVAKALDDGAWWSCNFQMAEILDGYGGTIDHEIERAEKAWAARANPQPPHAIGTRVKLPRGQAGEITGIYEYGAAKYCVKVDGDDRCEPPTNSRRIINFEDATPEMEAA